MGQLSPWALSSGSASSSLRRAAADSQRTRSYPLERVLDRQLSVLRFLLLELEEAAVGELEDIGEPFRRFQLLVRETITTGDKRDLSLSEEDPMVHLLLGPRSQIPSRGSLRYPQAPGVVGGVRGPPGPEEVGVFLDVPR